MSVERRSESMAANRTMELEPLIGPLVIATALGLLDDEGQPKLSAVYELCRSRCRNPLPVFRVGKYLRARPSEIAAWIERQRVRPHAMRSRAEATRSAAHDKVDEATIV